MINGMRYIPFCNVTLVPFYFSKFVFIFVFFAIRVMPPPPPVFVFLNDLACLWHLFVSFSPLPRHPLFAIFFFSLFFYRERK